LSFGLLWFLANLLIESTIIPLELIFEHRLYLPSSMLILAVVVLIYGLWESRQQAMRLSWAAVIIVLCLFTWQRNVVWGSEISLWRDVIAKSPNLPRVYQNLGRAYNIDERYQEAFDLFQQADNQEFDEVNIYNSWGKAAFQLGMIERSVELLERAVQLDKYHPESHYNLGVAYGSQGRVAEARREMIMGMGLQQPK
jgi:tetratricopeptide (TPR) repeat protein